MIGCGSEVEMREKKREGGWGGDSKERPEEEIE